MVSIDQTISFFVDSDTSDLTDIVRGVYDHVQRTVRNDLGQYYEYHFDHKQRRSIHPFRSSRDRLVLHFFGEIYSTDPEDPVSARDETALAASDPDPVPKGSAEKHPGLLRVFYPENTGQVSEYNLVEGINP
jgi:hypothetical protein